MYMKNSNQQSSTQKENEKFRKEKNIKLKNNTPVKNNLVVAVMKVMNGSL